MCGVASSFCVPPHANVHAQQDAAQVTCPQHVSSRNRNDWKVMPPSASTQCPNASSLRLRTASPLEPPNACARLRRLEWVLLYCSNSDAHAATNVCLHGNSWIELGFSEVSVTVSTLSLLRNETGLVVLSIKIGGGPHHKHPAQSKHPGLLLELLCLMR